MSLSTGYYRILKCSLLPSYQSNLLLFWMSIGQLLTSCPCIPVFALQSFSADSLRVMVWRLLSTPRKPVHSLLRRYSTQGTAANNDTCMISPRGCQLNRVWDSSDLSVNFELFSDAAFHLETQFYPPDYCFWSSDSFFILQLVGYKKICWTKFRGLETF